MTGLPRDGFCLLDKVIAMKKRSSTLILSAALIVSLFGTACEQNASQTGDEVEAEPTVDAEAGREVFELLCITCHGPGASPEENLTGVTERIDYAEYEEVMVEGRGLMPAWGSVNAQQRRNIWEFLKTYEVE